MELLERRVIKDFLEAMVYQAAVENQGPLAGLVVWEQRETEEKMVKMLLEDQERRDRLVLVGEMVKRVTQVCLVEMEAPVIVATPVPLEVRELKERLV